jgi:hypothetical protein
MGIQVKVAGRIRPVFLRRECFHAEVTDRTVRSFLFRRDVYAVRIEDGFALLDEKGDLWRPVTKVYDSDAASVPHPLDWLVPAFNVLRYKRSSMGIHDPACGEGMLEKWDRASGTWKAVRVSRKKADWLFNQGIRAEGGWRITARTYWAGVRCGAALKIGSRRAEGRGQ